MKYLVMPSFNSLTRILLVVSLFFLAMSCNRSASEVYEHVCKIYADIAQQPVEFGDGSAYTCSLAEMEALTGGSDNVSADPLFLDINDDWHFSVSSQDSVTAGGLNGEDDGGWGFTTDKDGVTRPGTGSNWSMGTYEP